MNETSLYKKLVDVSTDLNELANELSGALKMVQGIQKEYIETNKHHLIGQTINKISEDIVYLESLGALRSGLTIRITKEFKELLRSYISTDVVNDLADVTNLCGIQVVGEIESDNIFTYKISRRYK